MFPLIPFRFHKMTASSLRLRPAPVETRPLFRNSHKNFGVEALTASDDPTPRALVGSLSTWHYVHLKERTRWFLPKQFNCWIEEMEKGMVNSENRCSCEAIREVGSELGHWSKTEGLSGPQTPQLRSTGSYSFPCGVGGTMRDAESGWAAHGVKRPSPISTRADMSR